MRVLVDTSVWVDFFNQRPSSEAGILTRLIEDEVELVTCGVVLAEFFQGIRKTRALSELQHQFLGLSYVAPREPESYLAAADLFRRLRANGITIRSTIDCLIASLAAENDLLLLARDRDMAHILTSGLCDVQRVPFHIDGPREGH